MKKILFVLLFVSGCGTLQRSCTAWTGDFTYRCSKAGTEYVQSDSGIAPLYAKDGKPVECN